MELWKHQLRALEMAEANGGSLALFADPGTGKTRTAIEILRARMNREKRLLKVLVFTPPIVIQNFRAEWLKFSKVPADKVVALTGSATRRLKFFQESGGAIFITNYEALLMTDLYRAMAAWQPDVIIWDEAHKLKDRKSKRSKAADQLANPFGPAPQKLLLTGTPVLKDSQDLFHQFLVLDGGKTFGSNFFAFQARFYRDRNAGMPKQKYFPNWEVMTLKKDGFDGEAAMSKLMEGRALYVKKSECLDLPPFIQQTLKVPMSPTQARLYQEMKQDLITYLGDDACVATLAMTKALRLMQIASGYIKTAEGLELSIVSAGLAPKQEALLELLEQITPNAKVLVWACWRHNYEQIREIFHRLDLGFVEVHGDVSPTKKQKAIRRFQEDPTVRCFLGHPGSGGIGVNLVEASYSIFYSRTFSLEHSLQAEARNYRAGSEKFASITRYDLVAEGTIEEIILERLVNKIEISDKLLKGLALQLQEQGIK